MKILLVNMPWGSIEVPSLALGILRTAAESGGHEVQVRHANLDFVDWVVGRTAFGLGDYTYYSTSSYFQGAGDWVFSSALYDRPGDVDAFSAFLAANGAGAAEIAMTTTLHGLAPEFTARLATDLAGERPDVVGFTTTFQQNTASLAAARLLKRLSPGTRIVFGGANCDGEMGAALHRSFPFVDHVVRGEGETAFPALLAALAEDDPGTAGASRTSRTSAASAASGDDTLAGIPGLCWRDGSGTSRANPMSRRPLAPGQILAPAYDGFFERLDASPAARWVQPKLLVEGSRGCWWGEKHHCTFCGLNGSFMEFRSKSPDRFYDEVTGLAERHQVLDFVVVDNILDMGYFDTVLRRLAESDHDIRLHFEVKSNLRRHQFQLLGEAGAVMVQPGIESLSTPVLRLMDKGVTGCQNVRALRDAQSAGVSSCWNYLYGFPGEADQDYRAVIRQIPLLHHLEPPAGASRIAIERFSPYFDKPELGFPDLRPAQQYAEIYRLPENELTDLAYLFSAAPQGIDEPLAAELSAAIDTWHQRYPASRLTYQDLGTRIVLLSRRQAYDWTVLELSSPERLALFRLLDQPRGLATLTARAGTDEPTVRAVLDDWIRRGLVFQENDTFIQVAVEAGSQVLFRLDDARPGEEKSAEQNEQQEARHAVAVG
ncbi:RiPP maturation radical SAM C-methyltransferase [Kitasatospora sp. NPDC087315]|uniref:RiPP maturation radical SAM C-methyltransferase n=1 Tax=Kitasatospora sp. NPDC087315 TaxID=3364069 RepID=UPI0038088D28